MSQYLNQLALLVLVCLIAVLVMGQTRTQIPEIYAAMQAEDLNDRGLELWKFGKKEEGIAALLEAVERDPSVAAYHFNLAFLCTDVPEIAMRVTGHNKAALFDRIQRESLAARILDPGDFPLAQSYATNFLLAKRFGIEPDWEKAVKAWEYCLELRKLEHALYPSTTTVSLQMPILLQLARMELKLEHFAKARMHTELALAIRPLSVSAKRLLQRAEEGEVPS